MVLILECGVVPLLLRSRSFPVRCPENICRSEEHTSELQSQSNLVCRLLLEKKKKRHSLTLTAYDSQSACLFPHATEAAYSLASQSPHPQCIHVCLGYLCSKALCHHAYMSLC